MAKEYIEREAALNCLKIARGYCPCAYEEISNLPAADVAPVRHGKWVDLREDDMDYEWKCSSCGETFGMAHEDVSPYDVGLNCCPNCGCRMDLEG